MKIVFNETFARYLSAYGLPPDLSFPCDLPAEVSEIINSDILFTELGVTLSALNKLRAPLASGESTSTVEYDDNHFHLDWLHPDEPGIFKLGIHTLVLLAQKFQQNKILGVRFCYSFQSRELAKQMDVDLGMHNTADEYYTRDRLSFYKLRHREDIVSEESFVSVYSAQLFIDV